MPVRVPPRWLRRALLPAIVVVELALLGVSAAAGAVCVLVWPLTRRRRAGRVAGFVCTYMAVELFVLSVCGWYWLRSLPRRENAPWWDGDHAELLRKALGALLGAGRALLGFRIELTEPPDIDVLEGDDPVLVVARHGGPGDSFALVQLLLDRYRRRPRIVAKDLLALDPALDVLVHRVGGVFIGGGQPGSASELRRVAAELAPRDALLLFPEGGNWTPARQERVRVRLRARGARRMAAVAEQLHHVLPPRTAGVLACVAGRPDGPIVIVAHIGLETLTSAAQIWANLPFPHPMSVRWWKAGVRPPVEDPAAAKEWLITEWAVVDEWIGTQADRDRRIDPERPRPTLSADER